MTDAETRREARRRAPQLIALGVCAAVLLLLAAVIAERLTIARSLIDAQLRALGLEEVEQEVERFGFAELGVRDLRIGSEGDLVVEKIDASYSLSSLMAGRLEELSVRGVRLRGIIDGAGVSFGALDPLLENGEGGGKSSAPIAALPVASIALEDVEVQLETPRGPFAASFEARLRDTGGGELHVTAGGGNFRLPDDDLEVRGITVDADLDRSTGLPLGSLRIESLVDTQEPPRLPELALEGTFEAAAAEVSFDVTAASPGRPLELTFRGTHDLATGSGEALVTMKPVEFEPDGLQPAALSPLLGEWLEAASGSVTAQGAIAWGGDQAIRGGIDLVVQELSASSALASFECLTAGIRVDGPWPPSTPPEQQVYMTRVDFGLELINGVVTFQIRPDGILDVASAEWSLAGGTARAGGQIDLHADTQELVLELANIDLSELLTLVDIDGLTGSGRLEGRIPLTRRGQVLEIRGGKLSAAKGGGWIRYRAAPAIAGAANPEAELGVAFAVLENLRYDELEATLDGDAAGPVTIAFHISGANPDYLAGHPVEFNPVFESRLVDLLRKETAVYRIPASIEKKVQALLQATPGDTRLPPPSGEACRPALDAARDAR
jgi:hypothetical protein